MENITNKPPANEESFWAAVQAITEMQKEISRLQTETAIQMAETDRKMAETDRKMAETDRKMAETALQMAETDRKIAETALQMAETDRQISRLEKVTGGITNNNGAFAEEYFINSINEGKKTFFGEKFDKLLKSVVMFDENNKTIGEIDIMLVNGKAIAIYEVKFRVRKKNVDSVLKKIKPFRKKFPEYKDHKVFLGIASMVFDKEIEDKCIENGIAVLKQVGDVIVVNDENVKSF